MCGVVLGEIMAEIIKITDFSDKRLDVYARLSESQLTHFYEPDPGLFITESPKVIERALIAGYEPVSMLLEQSHIDKQAKEIIGLCDKLSENFPIFTAEFDILTRLTGFKLTRGALCVMKRRALPEAEDIILGKSRIAVLENVVNPTNVGAIFRSAAALGMEAVLLKSGCTDPLYRRAARVSMGTVFQVPWTFADENIFDILQNNRFKTVAMALKPDSVNINDPKLMSENNLAVFLGAEGDGLLESTIEKCDYTVCIPMSHGVDSLNVAAASAVAFWQLGLNNNS